MHLSSCCIKILLLAILSCMSLPAAELVKNKQGVQGYEDTPYLSWINYRVHDNSRPKPTHVDSLPITTHPPADAVVLFDGSSMERWNPIETWAVKHGILVAQKGVLVSKESFGDCQIHLEFKVPTEKSIKFTDRGNNGVGLMGFYEIQIFDSHPMHKEKLYADGQCASIYGQTPPLVNACRKPGEWQSFDITFTAPVFKGERLVSPAYVTVYHNGLLVQNHEKIWGPTLHRGIAPYKTHPSKLPITLKGHDSKVEFRNIWVRPL
jgi:hypothetical protein